MFRFYYCRNKRYLPNMAIIMECIWIGYKNVCAEDCKFGNFRKGFSFVKIES